MSGRIRTEIGLSKRRLKDAQDRIAELDPLENLRKESAEVVYEEIVESVDLAATLRTEQARIRNLHEQWVQLFNTDSNEKKVMEDYKERLGDYLDIAQGVTEQLTSLGHRYDTLCAIHKSMVSIPEEYPIFQLPATISILETSTPLSTTSRDLKSALGAQTTSTSTTSQSALGTQATSTSTISNSALGTSGTSLDTAMGSTNVIQGSSDVNMRLVPDGGTTLGTTLSNFDAALPLSGTIGVPTVDNTGITGNTNGDASHSITVNPLINTSTLQPIMPQFPMAGYNFNPFQVTLPPLTLKTFSGNHLEFAPFMSLFNTIIGNQPIRDVAKFQYLVSALDGDALALIQYLPITDENYAHAVSILKDNYGDSYRTRHHLLRQLQDLQSVATSKSTKEINTFWTKATVTFNQLKNIAPDCDNKITADIIMQKLPRFYISKLLGNRQNMDYTASQLLVQIHRLIQTDQLVSTVYHQTNKEERATTMAAQTRNHQSRNQPKDFQHPRQQQSSRGQAAPTTPCVFCASQENFHRHHDCPTYRTANERHNRARQLHLCFKCLRQHDDYRTCPRHPKCKKCEGNHQTSFCKHHESPVNGQPQQKQQFGRENVPTNRSGTGPQGNNRSQSFAPMLPQQPSSFTPGQQQMQRSQQNGNSQFNVRPTNRVPFNPRTHGTTNFAIAEEQSTDPNYDGITATVNIAETINVSHDGPHVNCESIKDQSSILLNATKQPVAMMAIQMLIDDQEGNPIPATVLFDNGSDRSFISTTFIDKLKIPAESETNLLLHTFANSENKAYQTRNFPVFFNFKDEKRCVLLTEINFITARLNRVQLDDNMIPKLMDSSIMSLPRIQTQPDILIGMDSMYRLLGATTSQVLPNGMILHHTDCGIIVTGQESYTEDNHMPDMEPFRSSTLLYSQGTHTPLGILSMPIAEHEAIQDSLEKFWIIDNTGSTEMMATKDEENAFQFYLDTTTREIDGRYTVRWPYNQSTKKLPDNRFLANFRLQSTLKRLSKDENLKKQYNDIILDQLVREFIEFVEDENKKDGSVVHYLSHHPIFKISSKSTKVRIVFDASARINKSSQCLNDVLHTGISLLPQIPGVCLRIRCPEILISGDIEKAFLQLGLDIRDRDACRFLWHFPGEDRPRCLRFKRVPFGVKTSPYLLNATIKHHLQQIDNELSRAVLKNVYVDNIFIGVATVAQGKLVYHDSKAMFDSAKMRLTQFFSNSTMLNDYIAEKEGLPAEGAEQKLLGIAWNTEHDQLGLNLPSPITSQLTKRRILKTIATAYDPLGLLVPVILLGKLFFQKLWLRTMDWDSPLTNEEIVEWKSIEKKWAGERVNIRRQYFDSPLIPTDVFELHVFSDASEGAYGAVAYLRRLRANNNEAVIIASKSRVSPVKKNYSIPQKELMGIEKAAFLGQFLLTELELNVIKCYIWSDSLCSVDQIATNNANTTFSRNRIRKIKELMPQAVFTHVPGKLNPADLVSRGCSLEELRSNPLWWKGPPYLNSQDPLPIRESSIQQAICNFSMSALPKTAMEPFVDSTRFNSFNKLLNVIMTVLLFVTKLFKRDDNPVKRREQAKKIIIQIAQSLSPPSEELIRNLHLKWENNIWYFDGRQPSNRVPFLPQGRISQQLIMEIHRKFHHCSPLYTLAKLREEAWITHGISTVKKVIKTCRHCKRNTARPFFQPDFPPLPDFRINWTRPFTNVGMDYCGPVKAKCFDATRKFYFLLFTCLTTRFTTVELVSSMDSRALLNAIRRVAAQFGSPQMIYTDNAAQMKMLEKVMREARNQQERLLLPSSDLPVFKFITALSPWSGGIYERVVGIFKNCLVQAGTTRTLLTEDDLRTLMKEAESIINDRPLTTTTSDINDLNPLRPSDFVMPNKQLRRLLNVEETLDTMPLPTTQASLLEDWMRLSSLTGHFISRWNTDYLQMLQGRLQTEHRQSHLNNHGTPKVGDIVLIDESGQFGKSRVHWPLAKVVKVDTRSAVLYTGKTKETVERPFRKIVPLEITSKTTMDQAASTNIDIRKSAPTNNTSVASRTRSKTAAGVTTLAMMVIALSFLSTVNATSATVSNVSTTTTHSSVTGAGMSIEDAYSVMVSLLEEIATRLGYAIILFGLFALVYCITILAQMSAVLTTIFIFAVKTIRCFLRCLKKLVCYPFSRRNMLLLTSIVTVNRTIFLIAMASLFSSIMGCNDIAHISSKEAVCYYLDNSQECVINTVSIINLRTMGSTSCLQFQVPTKDQEGKTPETLLSLKVEAEAIVMTCNKRVIFYARDHKFEYEYIKRCDSAGSCSIDRCANIQPDEDLEELSNRAKSSPGYTSCAPGCGCINCGCFWCDPACLFYRYYAEPTIKDIYEISYCSTWTPTLRVKITLNENSTIRQELHPGVKFKLPGTNLSVTAINWDNPPLPAHHATFIAAYEDGAPKWHSFTHIRPSAPGVPTRGLVGELHCSSKANAESFKCTFDPALCKCVSFATKVACHCQESKISDYKTTNMLPFKGQHHSILYDKHKDKIIIETTQDSLVAFQVEAVNATINRKTTITKCTATQVSTLQGCHSCEKGANTTVSCHSRIPMKATILCSDYQTSVDCGPQNIDTEIRIALSSGGGKESMTVEMNCSVSCGVLTSMVIKGQLEFEVGFISGKGSAAQGYGMLAQVPSWLASISKWMYDSIFEKIFYIALVAVIAFIVGLIVWKAVQWWTAPYLVPIKIAHRHRNVSRHRQKLL